MFYNLAQLFGATAAQLGIFSIKFIVEMCGSDIMILDYAAAFGRGDQGYSVRPANGVMQNKQSRRIVGKKITDVNTTVIARLGFAPGGGEQFDFMSLPVEEAAHVQDISADSVPWQDAGLAMAMRVMQPP